MGENQFDFFCELKEISSSISPQLSYELIIDEEKSVVSLKAPVQLKLKLTSESTLAVQLNTPEKTISSLKICLVSLFGRSLTGRIDRWFKLKSEEYKNLRIRIAASVSPLEKQKRPNRSVSPSRPRSRSKQEAVCPYFKAVKAEEIPDRSLLEKFVSNRPDPDSNTIKLSLELENTPISAGFDFNHKDIEELTLAKLQQLPGAVLKQLLNFLCQENKSLDAIVTKLPELKSQFQEKLEERRNLEKKAQQEIETLREGWTKKHLEILALQEKRKLSKQILIEKKDNERRLEAELDILKAHLGDLKREKILLETQKFQNEDCAKSKDELEEMLEKSMKIKKVYKDRINKAEGELEEFLKRTSQEMEEIQNDNKEVRAKLQDVNAEYKKAYNENQELMKKFNELKVQVESRQSIAENLKSSYETARKETGTRDDLNSQLRLITENLEKESSKILDQHTTLLSSKACIVSQLNDLEYQLSLKEHSILSLEKSLFEAKTSKISKEQICCIRADLAQTIQDLESLSDFYKNNRNKILPDLFVGSELLKNESERVLSQAEKINMMIERIEEKEQELDGLKGEMGEVKKRKILYVPAKDDPIDMILADYLNERDVPVKFIRQDGGNYLFGSKKVYVKQENSKLLVKVGGGFTSIEEFLSIYTPLELEKAEGSPKLSSALSSRSPDASPSKVTSPRKK